MSYLGLSDLWGVSKGNDISKYVELVVCVLAHARICSRAYMLTYMCTCVWRKEDNFGCPIGAFCLFFHRQESFTGLELTQRTRLTGQQAPGICPFSSQNWNYKVIPSSAPSPPSL